MFLTAEQVEQLDELCEKVAGTRTRSGRVIIEIRNNMPRNFIEEINVCDEDHVLVGRIQHIHRCAIPQDEIDKHRQKNRLKPQRG